MKQGVFSEKRTNLSKLRLKVLLPLFPSNAGLPPPARRAPRASWPGTSPPSSLPRLTGTRSSLRSGTPRASPTRCTVCSRRLPLVPTAPSNVHWPRGAAGLSRTMINNMVLGVTTGYERKLTLVGVGYRAKVSRSRLDAPAQRSLRLRHLTPYHLPRSRLTAGS